MLLIPVNNAFAITEDFKITALDATASNQFGFSVSISGDRTIVGAVGDDNAGSFSGSAYIFDFDGASWTQTAKLTALDAAAGDFFGFSVSISGDRAIVGAFGNDDAGSSSGSAYIFDFDGASWTQTAKLTALDAAAFDNFGVSVSISGDKTIVGARLNDDAGSNSGSAYIFDFDGASWTQTAKLTALDAAASDQFGFSVSISGDKTIIGARLNDDAGRSSGSAYIFDFDGASWTQTAKLTASDAAASDQFGISVSISGDRAIVGARLNDDAGSNSGSAYIFDFDGASWTQTAKLTALDAATFDSFGVSVSISGDKAIVGALGNDDAGSSSGSAYIFDFDGASWTQTAKLTALDAAASDFFGFSVSISGDKAAIIGARLNDDAGRSSGSAYIFQFNSTPVADANNPYSGDEGSLILIDGTVSSDPDGDTITFSWSTDGSGTFDDATLAQPSVSYPDDGIFNLDLQVTDTSGESDTDSTTVTVSNVAPSVIVPSITADNLATINEGDTFTGSGSFTDPGADTWTATVDYGDGTGSQPLTLNPDKMFNLQHTYLDDDDDDTYTVTVSVTDDDNGLGSASFDVIVNNLPPTLSLITAILDPVSVGTEISASASFTDPGTADTHTAQWDWGDGTVTQGAVSDSVTYSHIYNDPGIYTITLTVTDDDGGSDSKTFEFIVVYDPSGGFVTGGGWIDSPAGAYTADTSLTGKAKFGFVSKYKKGADIPTGVTQFQFKVADLKFHSDSYEWLVVSGAKAMFKGVGTINGAGNFGFMLSAIDEKLTSSTDTDLFRIKIVDKATDTLVYDNKVGETDNNADPATAISGGSIIIHKAK